MTKWITIPDAVEWLNRAVSYFTIRRLVTTGRVRGTKIGGRMLVDQDALNEYVRNESYRVIAPANRARRKK